MKKLAKKDIEEKRISLMKEAMKKRIRNMINESRHKNISNVEQVMKFKGRKPKSVKARINQIYQLINAYGINSKLYSDDYWAAKDDYRKAIESLGAKFYCWCDNGGYTDYDSSDNMPRSKKYNIEITFEDGMKINGYMKFMAAGTIEDPFKRYDTCIVLEPTSRHELTSEGINNVVSKTIKHYLKEDEDEIGGFGRYENDYKDDNFSPSDMPNDMLADYCLNNDFLYIYKTLRGWKVLNANSSEIQKDIVKDIYSCAYIEPTHEMDIFLESDSDLFNNNEHVTVFKLNGTKDGDYYIVYQE